MLGIEPRACTEPLCHISSHEFTIIVTCHGMIHVTYDLPSYTEQSSGSFLYSVSCNHYHNLHFRAFSSASKESPLSINRPHSCSALPCPAAANLRHLQSCVHSSFPCQWEPMPCAPLCPASFMMHNVFKVSPCGCDYQPCIPLYG